MQQFVVLCWSSRNPNSNIDSDDEASAALMLQGERNDSADVDAFGEEEEETPRDVFLAQSPKQKPKAQKGIRRTPKGPVMKSEFTEDTRVNDYSQSGILFRKITLRSKLSQ